MASTVAENSRNVLNGIRPFAEAKAAYLLQIKMPAPIALPTPLEASPCAKRTLWEHNLAAVVQGQIFFARASVHIASTNQAAMILAKLGMGVDADLPNRYWRG
jgi:methylaspartate ammonia-lyase